MIIKIDNALIRSKLTALSTLMSILLIAPSAALAETSAMTNGEHSVADVDISEPITALERLTSLKNTEALTLDNVTFQHFTTSNGVPVRFFATDQLPIVDIDMRFNAGSAYDSSIKPQAYGLASMVAQLLTKGTKTMTENEYAEVSEQLGIELSSQATQDHLTMSLRSLSDQDNLLPALDLMNDAINTPRFDSDVFARSKAQQVLGLKQMRQNPAYIAGVVFGQTLYGNHPYAHSTYGTINTIPKLTLADLQQFHDRYLVANNATLSITGDLNLTEAKKIAEKLSRPLPMGQAASPLPMPKPPKTAQHIHINYDSDQTTVLIGQLGVAIDPDPAVTQQHTQFNIGNEILAGQGFHSRLMAKVRKELGYTYGIGGGMSPKQVNGPYLISFSTRNDKVVDAIDATLDTINATIDNGVTVDELTLTKESLINSYPMRFASNASIHGTLSYLNAYQLPDAYITNYANRVKRASLRDVNQALKNRLQPDRFIIVTVGDSIDEKLVNHKHISPSKPAAHFDTKSYDSIQAYLEQHKP